MNKADSIKDACFAIGGGVQSWKLGIREREDSEIEEVVLRIQGVVCNRELPPIQRPFEMYVIYLFNRHKKHSRTLQ